MTAGMTSADAMAGALLLLLVLAVVSLPVIYCYCRWFVAVPAAVAEGLGPLAALRRSGDLTAGNRWIIFGVAAVFYILGLVVRGICHFLLGELLSVTSRSDYVLLSELAGLGEALLATPEALAA